MSKTLGKATGKSGKRGCLCEDGTYHSDCCQGYLINQRIGNDKNQSTNTVNKTSVKRSNTSINGGGN